MEAQTKTVRDDGFLSGFRQTRVYTQASAEERSRLEAYLRDLFSHSFELRLRALSH